MPSPSDPSSTISSDAAALDAERRAAESGGQGAPAVAPPPGPDWLAEARGLWELMVGALSVRFPVVRQCYTPEKISQLAAAWAPVLERHKLDLGRFTIYFVAAGVTLPAVAESALLIRAQLAAESQAVPGEAPPVMPARPAMDAGLPVS